MYLTFHKFLERAKVKTRKMQQMQQFHTKIIQMNSKGCSNIFLYVSTIMSVFCERLLSTEHIFVIKFS